MTIQDFYLAEGFSGYNNGLWTGYLLQHRLDIVVVHHVPENFKSSSLLPRDETWSGNFATCPLALENACRLSRTRTQKYTNIVFNLQ